MHSASTIATSTNSIATNIDSTTAYQLQLFSTSAFFSTKVFTGANFVSTPTLAIFITLAILATFITSATLAIFNVFLTFITSTTFSKRLVVHLAFGRLCTIQNYK